MFWAAMSCFTSYSSLILPQMQVGFWSSKKIRGDALSHLPNSFVPTEPLCGRYSDSSRNLVNVENN